MIIVDNYLFQGPCTKSSCKKYYFKLRIKKVGLKSVEMENHLRSAIKVLLLTGALLFSPVLIPGTLAVFAAVLTVAGILLGACFMFAAAVFPFLFGIFAVPLLFSTFVTFIAYFLLKIARNSSKKLMAYAKRFSFQPKVCTAASKEISLQKKDSWGNLPSYDEEMKKELEHDTIPHTWYFPLPKATAQEMGDYINQRVKQKIDELHQLVHLMHVPHASTRCGRLRRKTL